MVRYQVLLLLLTVGLFGCGRQSPPTQKEGTARAKAQSPQPEKLGEITNQELRSQLKYNEDSQDPEWGLQMCAWTMTDGDMKHLRGLTKLVALDLTGGGYTDKGLKQISGLTGLRELYLSDRAMITDAGVAQLRLLTNLLTLSLHGRGITDACIEDLKELKNLKELDIRGTAITDAGVAELRQALPKAVITHGP